MTLPSEIHLENDLDNATLDALADFICGDRRDRFPVYRTSSELTRFFQTLHIDEEHDGSTRKLWVLKVLKRLQPSELEKIILRLADPREYGGLNDSLKLAIKCMNEILPIESLAVGFDGTRPTLKHAEPLNLNETAFTKATLGTDEAEFLNKQFSDDIKIQGLGLDSEITSYLQNRVNEAQACPKNKVPLGTIFCSVVRLRVYCLPLP